MVLINDINNETNNNSNSNLVLVKPKRKISCTVCRLKKIKCDGIKPFCQQCKKRGLEEKCTYLKPGQVGRPPKNAVVNKLVLNRAKQSNISNNIYKEFIFENLVYTIHTDAKFINNDKHTNLYAFIDGFTGYEESLQQVALYRSKHAFPIPEILIYDVSDLFSWTSGDMLNVVIGRISSIKLEMFAYYDPISAHVFQKMIFQILNEPRPNLPQQNPLTSISPEKTVEYIDLFFRIHPHSIALNKTLFLQSFWTDALDPLLLAVVIGTTIYFSRLLEGKPVMLWHAVNREERNPFLDYTYFLLYKATSEATLQKYQALVLLGNFESTFGHPRRGISSLGLSFLVGENLGIFNGSYKKRFNETEIELISISVWLSVNSTTRGCLDLGQFPSIGPTYLNSILPPPNIDRSLSYQLEFNNGEDRSNPTYDYMLESFFILSVSSKFTMKMCIEFPEVKYNLYKDDDDGYPSRPPGTPKVYDLIPRLKNILNEFERFIQKNRDTWTKRQLYMIESTWLIYEIHIIFIKHFDDLEEGTGYYNSCFHIFNETYISYDDHFTKERIKQALPLVYRILDHTIEFLNDAMKSDKPFLLPKSSVLYILETCWEILLLKVQADPLEVTPHHYMSIIEVVIEKDIWKDWSEISTLRAKVVKYQNKISSDQNRNPISNLDASPSSSASLPSPSPSSSSDPSVALPGFTTEDQLALASFFDPCATWLDPLMNLPIDMMLMNNNDNNNNNNNGIYPINNVDSFHINNDMRNGLPTTNGNNNNNDIYNLPMSSIIELPNNTNVPDIVVESTNDLSFLDSDIPSSSLSASLSPPNLSDTNDANYQFDNNNYSNIHLFSDSNVSTPSPMLSSLKSVNSSFASPDIQSILFDDDPFII
ncbi:unnamed protein product [Cunninghamella blakesleeana]